MKRTLLAAIITAVALSVVMVSVSANEDFAIGTKLEGFELSEGDTNWHAINKLALLKHQEKITMEKEIVHDSFVGKELANRIKTSILQSFRKEQEEKQGQENESAKMSKYDHANLIECYLAW